MSDSFCSYCHNLSNVTTRKTCGTQGLVSVYSLLCSRARLLVPPLLICVVQLFLDFNFIFSEVFKDSLKVLSQHYRHKLIKMAVCINGVNRMSKIDSVLSARFILFSF